MQRSRRARQRRRLRGRSQRRARADPSPADANRMGRPLNRSGAGAARGPRGLVALGQGVQDGVAQCRSDGGEGWRRPAPRRPRGIALHGSSWLAAAGWTARAATKPAATRARDEREEDDDARRARAPSAWRRARHGAMNGRVSPPAFALRRATDRAANARLFDAPKAPFSVERRRIRRPRRPAARAAAPFACSVWAMRGMQ